MTPLAPTDLYAAHPAGDWRGRRGILPGVSSGITPPAGFVMHTEDQFTTNERWSVYDNSTFGAPSRVQRYMAGNTVFGSTDTSAGATGGTSLCLDSKRESVGGQAFTAGMLDSKGVSVYYPLYCYMEIRAKTPHGQGLWPAWWLTAKTGGANCSEWDILEYFHGQVPGKNSSTLHGQDGTGTFKTNRYTNNVGGRTFFEAPTYTPAWHTWATEILPVTSSAGTTIGSLNAPSQNVRFRVLLDGVEVWRFVDTDALYWTTNGGTIGSFWNVYLQGCQISGNYVGHPDDPLGYSAYNSACLIGGTAPNGCTITSGGYTVQRAGAPGATATMGGVATRFEIDYFYCATPV